jgi:hypothetical protein
MSPAAVGGEISTFCFTPFRSYALHNYAPGYYSFVFKGFFFLIYLKELKEKKDYYAIQIVLLLFTRSKMLCHTTF